MDGVGEGHHEDVVRAFFRYRAGDIENLLPHVVEVTRKSAYELGRSLAASLPEANRIVLVSPQMSFLRTRLADKPFADRSKVGFRLS